MLELVKELLKSTLFLGLLLMALRLLACGWVERRWTAHGFDRRAVFLRDLATTAFLAFVILPVADLAIRFANLYLPIPEAVRQLPLALRMALYFVLADLAHYWVHRLMHTPLLWRVHKWHHSPTHMSWLAGNRESLPDAILVRSGYALFWPLMEPVPGIVGVALFAFSFLKNDWMHLNVTWRLPWLEWLVVSPRYHHIHHSSDPAHYRSNYGILFSFWDRLFGTWTDPAVERDSLRFGIGERVPAARLVLGV